MNDLISIIIPIFNAEKYLKDCLESIKNQSYTNFEVLLINDGSTDNSSEICNYYVNIDSRFLLFNKCNEGVSKSRNFGIDNAVGKYIVFVDSVNINYLKDFIVNIDDSNQIIIQDINRITENIVIPKYYNYKQIFVDLNNLDHFKFENIEYFSGVPVNKLFKTDILKINMIRFIENQSFGEDRLFFYDYLNYVFKIKIIENSNYNYFQRVNSSVSKKHDILNYFRLLEAENKLMKRLFGNTRSIPFEYKAKYTSLVFQIIDIIQCRNYINNKKDDFLKDLAKILNSRYIIVRNPRRILKYYLLKARLFNLLLKFK